MGRWDDKFERHAKKWASWKMQEYSQHDRVLTKIIEDKARQYPDHVVFQFRDDPITLGEINERINKAANGFLSQPNLKLLFEQAATKPADIRQRDVGRFHRAKAGTGRQAENRQLV